MSQAMRVNLKLREGAEPFTAEDFMGLGNRELRERERQKGVVRAAELSRKLAFIKPLKENDPEPDNLPAWARKDYGKSSR